MAAFLRKNTRFCTSLFMLVAALSVSGKNTDHSPIPGTILFKVTNPETTHVSYLFGSHHAFGKSFFDSLDIAKEALAASDLLVKENLDIPGHLAQDIINQRTATTNWGKLLNKENKAFVENLFATSPTDMNKMTPTELYVFLNRYFNQQVCLTKDPADTTLTLDNYIGSLAEQRNMQLIGLETTEEQIDLINKDVEGMPEKVHKRRLAGIIENIQTRNTSACSQTGWYLEMQMDYRQDQPCSNTLMLTDRNNRWLQTLVPRLQSDNCFVVVGLSHLMYDCGLIAQLEGRGFKVEPVRLN